MDKDSSHALRPSIMICECLDGPYAGHIVRVGVRAALIQVRDLFDATRPSEWYGVVSVGDLQELKWTPDSRQSKER
jgi:hypothetical protein